MKSPISLALMTIAIFGMAFWIVASDMIPSGFVTGGAVPGQLISGNSPIRWTHYGSASEWTPGNVTLGNNGNGVLFSTNTPTYLARYIPNYSPANVDAPVPAWTDTHAETFINSTVSSSRTQDVFVNLRQMKTLPTDTSWKAKLSKYSSAGLDWEYTFATTPIALTLYHAVADVADNGKIVALVTNSTMTSTLATFNPSSNVPTSINTSFPISGQVRRFNISKNGNYAFAATNTGSHYFIDLATMQVVSQFVEASQTLCSGMSESGEWAAYSTFNQIKLFQRVNNQYVLTQTIPFSGNLANCATGTPFTSGMAISNNGLIAVTIYQPNVPVSSTNLEYDITLFNGPTGEQKWVYPVVGVGTNQQAPQDVKISDDGKIIAVAGWGTTPSSVPTIHVFMSDYSTPFYTYTTPGSVMQLSLSKDSHFLTWAARAFHANTLSSGGQIQLLDVFDAMPTPTIPAGISIQNNLSQPNTATATWSPVQFTSGYKLYLSTTNVQCPSSATPIFVSGGTSSSYAFSNLVGNTDYYFSMRAINDGKESACSRVRPFHTPNIISAGTVIVESIGSTNLSALPRPIGVVSLSWVNNIPRTEGISVWRATTPNVPTTGTPYATLQGNVTSYKDTHGVPGTTYYYRVTPTGATSEIAPSNVASATPTQPTCTVGTYVPALNRCQITFNVQNDDTIYKFALSGGTWSTVWNSTSGTLDNQTASENVFQNPTGRIDVPFLTFDTSSLPDSANIYESTLAINIESLSSFFPADDQVYVLRANNVLPNVGDNFEQCGYPMTIPNQPSLANVMDLSSVSAGPYAFTLNTNGFSAISRTSLTKLCLQSAPAYTGNPSTSSASMQFSSKEGPIPANAAKLTVYYLP